MTDIRLSIARPRPLAPLTTSTEPTTMPTTETVTETVTDLAHRILSTDDTAKAGEVHRLAAFIVDHAEHMAFDSARPAKVEALGQAGGTDLARRLEPMRPEPVGQIADSSETHA